MAKKVKIELIEIDLSKGVEHEHPDINTKDLYLAKEGGSYAVGGFDRQHYGLSFCGFYDAGLQFDAPGYNKSDWEQLWLIKRTKETKDKNQLKLKFK